MAYRYCMIKKIWDVWKYSLGSFSDDKTERYDNHIVLVRTILFLSYLITNCFIISGVIRHWNPPEETATKYLKRVPNTDVDYTKRPLV
jgi:hypothetical protein